MVKQTRRKSAELKNKKAYKTNRKEQYRKILKQIQGNPAKQNTKKNQNKKIKQRTQNIGKPKKI
jgi:hypothetical protein